MSIEDMQSYLTEEKSNKTQQFIKERVLECADDQDGRVLLKKLKIPYLAMGIPEFDSQKALDEAMALEEQFVFHRGNDSSEWKSLCIHGLDSQKTLSCDKYGYENERVTPYVWTEASEKCPTITNWSKRLLEEEYFEELYRVRYMWLGAGGYIKFHWDRPPGQNSLGPLNLALNMPSGCKWIFRDWGEVPFRPGDAYAVDVSNFHGVINKSNEPRVHLIVHGRYGNRYYDSIVNSKNTLLEKIRSGNNSVH